MVQCGSYCRQEEIRKAQTVLGRRRGWGCVGNTRRTRVENDASSTWFCGVSCSVSGRETSDEISSGAKHDKVANTRGAQRRNRSWFAAVAFYSNRVVLRTLCVFRFTTYFLSLSNVLCSTRRGGAQERRKRSNEGQW